MAESRDIKVDEKAKEKAVKIVEQRKENNKVVKEEKKEEKVKMGNKLKTKLYNVVTTKDGRKKQYISLVKKIK